jgi:hypothetical protein
MYTIGVDFPFQKRCPECGTIKPRSEFRKSAMRADGLQLLCRPCALRLWPLSYAKPILCTSCHRLRPGSEFKDIPFRGLWRCVSCRKTYDRYRYIRLLKRGKCYRHKNRDAVPGRRACAECLEEDRAYSKSRRVAAKNVPAPSPAGLPTAQERQSQ